MSGRVDSNVSTSCCLMGREDLHDLSRLLTTMFSNREPKEGEMSVGLRSSRRAAVP